MDSSAYADRVNIGAAEVFVILLVVLLVVGATRLPKIARSLGESKREFEKGLKGENGDTETNS